MEKPYTEQIAALDQVALRRECAIRRFMQELRDTIELRPLTPEAEAVLHQVRFDFTSKTAELLAPLFTAYETVDQFKGHLLTQVVENMIKFSPKT